MNTLPRLLLEEWSQRTKLYPEIFKLSSSGKGKSLINKRMNKECREMLA